VQELTEVSLADLTTLRLGGPARAVLRPDTEAELVDVVRTLDRAGSPLLLVGGGSNLVVADAGFAGTVVLVRTRCVDERNLADGGLELTAAAGEPWDELVAGTVEAGFGELAALSGIPGLVGAAPIQNIGAYGQELADVVRSVRVLDRRTGTVRDLAPADCGFGYRDSRFKRDQGLAVLAVNMHLTTADQPVAYAELANALGLRVGASAPPGPVRAAVLALRRGKGMVIEPDDPDPDTRSAGSFFTNPVLRGEDATLAALQAQHPDLPTYPAAEGNVKVSAAWLIERSGFTKGYGHGDARISAKHTLALTNRGRASTAELLALAAEIVAGVRDRFAITLTPEPVLIGCAIPAT
jgi:UDP-N-acetylmuramate dehydrogenase